METREPTRLDFAALLSGDREYNGAMMIVDDLKAGRVKAWAPESYSAPPAGIGTDMKTKSDETGLSEQEQKIRGKWIEQVTWVRDQNRGKLQCLLHSAHTLSQRNLEAADVVWSFVMARYGLPAGTAIPESRIECRDMAKRMVKFPWETH